MPQSVLMSLAVVATAVGLSMPAPAQASVAAAPMSIAVIEATLTGATCSITTADGATTTAPCDPKGWTAVLGPGWSAQMTATIHYNYSDDGLPLELSLPPSPLTQFQLDPFGFSILQLEFEAGAIYTFTSQTHCHVRTSPCGNIAPGGNDLYFGEYGFPPVFVSHNNFAEDVSGDISVTTGVQWLPSSIGQGVTWSHTLFVDPSTQVASAIPEPATWALMIGPLLGLGWLCRRRTVGAQA